MGFLDTGGVDERDDPPVNFSRAFVRAMTGLLGWGDKISPLSLAGDASSSLSEDPCSRPACESPDGRRDTESGRDSDRAPPKDSRLLVDRTPPSPGREVVEDVETCRAVREAGAPGGPIDVRELGTPGRTREPAEGTRGLDGVAVLDAVALGGPLICFVGDLVGDWNYDEHSPGRVLS